MLSTPLFTFVAVLVPVLAVQLPLIFHDYLQDHDRVILGDNGLVAWNLEKLPNPNDTDHLVFETVHSLLQRWPNTRMRNGKRFAHFLIAVSLSSPGHNIVPGIIPRDTLLYHGSSDDEVPLGLEWTATDPEHGHIYCMDPPIPKFQQTCWLMTLATTRTLKVVYFDGNSGANMRIGTMDTQELIAWNIVASGDHRRERQMMRDLCEWGADFGVDGFVRYVHTRQRSPVLSIVVGWKWICA